MPEKTYFTMREVSRKTQVPEYTVRYWEQKFRLLRPLRLSSGHRRYTQADIDALFEIKDLVFVKGYSLEGARKALAAKKRQKKTSQAAAAVTAGAKSELLEGIKKELRQLIKEL
ncbi:MAG: hypothetical protein A2X35_04105 [Elusimicrobia bacterium GWA2_61_42]|nr:MAG: hypothetical protein A2X35_04105 [Elusimicrobia bacterium GWA2_61_42]OGR74587.1 MAG: hypothetical protein A2X38_05310 [Elusimicrobia bacterium GWC2_61_25]